MAQDRFPHRLSIGLRVDPGGNRPLWPTYSTSLLAINVHDQLTKDRLIGIQQLLCRDHVVQLRDTMRSQLARVYRVRVGGFDESSSGELTNGDVIWMPIRTIWSEGHHHVRPHTPKMSHDFSNGLGWIGLIQLPIKVIQELDPVETKHFRGRKHFGLAPLAESIQSRIFLLFAPPASFSPRCYDQGGLNAFSSIFG